eukprot:TRINITY_DN4095_c0_g1_i2.p1 TRINITY_DN4095_c0_g1~~TRINITY_DN4095_c0_g1_i2.p1  ORF type:complete len:294 (-),score=58.37 TRINITY_DN4095_c0_g1_i2:801-1682(-)
MLPSFPSLGSPTQEKFKPSRTSLSLSSQQKKILITKITGQDRRCLTSRSGRSSWSSSSSDFVTSSSSCSPRKRLSLDVDKENEDFGGAKLYGDGWKQTGAFANRFSGFGEPRRGSAEDSDLEDIDTVDSDDDLPFYIETNDSSMKIETPVKGMADMRLTSPPRSFSFNSSLSSPYSRTVTNSGFSHSRALPIPYPQTARSSSSLTEASLREREAEKIHQTLVKCVEATSIPDSDFEPFLPVLPNTSSRLNCISVETVVDLINGCYDHRYDSVVIIDCRYDYEFEGGHIKGKQE